MRGMSPSVWFLGIVSVFAGTALAPHDVATFTVNCLRQRPSCTTSGTLDPTGMPVSVKVPSGAVNVVTRGLPAAVAPHTSHVIPAGNGCRPGSLGSFGT